MHYLEKLKQYSTKKILGEVDGYGIRFVRDFLDFLGKPDDGLTIFHIGGTSGKGSTSTLLSSLLASHQIKAGLFVSPHVNAVNERVQINNENINNSDLNKFLGTIFGEFEEFKKYQSDQGKKIRKLTYFEILLCVALLYFKSEGVKHAVIEVGLGGRLDPTNVLYGDYCVLTNVGLDHQKVLGNTVEEIAKDKVQIAKKNSSLITGVDQPSVIDIIRNWCEGRNMETLWQNKEFGIENIKISLEGTYFTYRKGNLLKNLATNLVGKHQALNAAQSITTFLEFAKSNGVDWSRDSINLGLKVKNFPGRFEIKSQNPLVIWDGAHNGDKMRALFNTIYEIIENRKLSILLAVKNDKDIDGIVDAISPLASQIKQVVLTNYKVSQDVQVVSANANTLENALNNKANIENIVYNPNAYEAYNDLVSNIQKGEALLVTGSFYLLNYVSNAFA